MKQKKITFFALAVITVVALIVFLVPVQVFSYHTCAPVAVPKRISVIKGDRMSDIKHTVEAQEAEEATLNCIGTESSVKLYIL